MQFSRRQFLQKIAGVCSLLSPWDLGGMNLQFAGAANNKLLLTIHLAGGNDGLNTLIPYRDQKYYDLRPNIAIDAQSVLPISNQLAFHPALSSMQQLFKAGKMAVVQNVGINDKTYSHMRAAQIWHSAKPLAISDKHWLDLYPHLHMACRQIEGFDTHENQKLEHAKLLEQLSANIDSLLKDIKTKCLDDNVLMLIYSEFGRKAYENNQGGTDHGHAGPVFVIGNKIKGGIYGDNPRLDDLDNGDLKCAIDFKQIYATILEKWLQVDSRTVLNEKLELVAFL